MPCSSGEALNISSGRYVNKLDGLPVDLANDNCAITSVNLTDTDLESVPDTVATLEWENDTHQIQDVPDAQNSAGTHMQACLGCTSLGVHLYTACATGFAAVH